MTKGPLVMTNELFSDIIIKDKSYILLRCHVLND
jgi:hypothetical protein